MMARWKVRLAIVLWLVLAFAVWNVIFDRVVVMAGRYYIRDANAAIRAGTYLPVEATMRPAIRRGVGLATLAAVPIAVFGVGMTLFAERRYRRRTSSKNEMARGSSD